MPRPDTSSRPRRPSRRPPAALLAGTAAALLLALADAGAGGGAAAQELGPLTRVSGGGSPFAGCTADRPGSQEGELFPNTEIEPFVAADPRNPNNLLVGHQQDRWSNGGARGNAARVSTNGGASWRAVAIPDVSLCSGGDFLRASDPWVDFSPDGVAYYMSLAIDPDRTSPSGEYLGFGRNAMLVNRSTNGGRSWGEPITLIETDDPRFLNDKNSLTADPTDPRLAYAVWDRLQDLTLPPPAASAEFPMGGGPAGARARAQWLKERARAPARAEEPTELFFKGPTLLTRTTNGGRSWERPRVILDPGPNAQTINNLVVVQPSGTVFVFFTHIFSNGGTRIGFLRSTDKGATFRGGPRYAASIATVRGVVTPDAQELVRDASILFDAAVDPGNGNLYLAWQDVRFRGIDEVAFSMSTDDGDTWSEPVRINRTPTGGLGNPLRGQVYVPSIEVGPGGVLVATYYDFRNDRGVGSEDELTDHWAVFCDPGRADCRKGASWGRELRLTNRPFDTLDAPVARGHFLGDYMGLERAGDAVYPVFGVAAGPNRADLFTRRITFRGGRGAAVAAAP